MSITPGSPRRPDGSPLSSWKKAWPEPSPSIARTATTTGPSGLGVVRVLIVDTYYPAFLDRHYAERPRLAAAGYDEQLQSLIERCFGTSDAYSQNLRRLGHDAHEVIVNCEPLQLSLGRRARSRRLAAPAGDDVAPRACGSPCCAGRARRDRRSPGGRVRPEVVYLQDLGALSLDPARSIA